MRTADEVTRFMGDTQDFGDLLTAKTAHIKDLVYESEVTLEWDFSKDSTKYQIARLVLRGKDGSEVKAAISVQELNHYLRVV